MIHRGLMRRAGVLLSLAADLAVLLVRFSKVDRIRIASSEGLWLRLSEGNRLLVRGIPWRVVRRQEFQSLIEDSNEPPGVSYLLANEREGTDTQCLATLRVELHRENARSISAKFWSDDSEGSLVQDACELFEEDIVIMSPTHVATD